MNKINKIVILLLSSFLLISIVACTRNPVAAQILSFKVTPLTITAGETVTATWEVAGTEPLKVLLHNVDVSDKTSMTFEPTKNTWYVLSVEGSHNSKQAGRLVIVEPAN